MYSGIMFNCLSDLVLAAIEYFWCLMCKCEEVLCLPDCYGKNKVACESTATKLGVLPSLAGSKTTLHQMMLNWAVD